MLTRVLEVFGVYKAYEKWLWQQVKNETPPEHIALILDGNRRWASQKEMNPWLGHQKGADTVEQLLEWCLKVNSKYITLYAFSTENFARNSKEVDQIMNIAAERFLKLLTDDRVHKTRFMLKCWAEQTCFRRIFRSA